MPVASAAVAYFFQKVYGIRMQTYMAIAPPIRPSTIWLVRME